MRNGKLLAICPLPKEDDQINQKLSNYKLVQFTSEFSLIESPMDIFNLNGQEISNDLKYLDKKKPSESFIWKWEFNYRRSYFY